MVVVRLNRGHNGRGYAVTGSRSTRHVRSGGQHLARQGFASIDSETLRRMLRLDRVAATGRCFVAHQIRLTTSRSRHLFVSPGCQ